VTRVDEAIGPGGVVLVLREKVQPALDLLKHLGANL
jgi:hypothetical protein